MHWKGVEWPQYNVLSKLQDQEPGNVSRKNGDKKEVRPWRCVNVAFTHAKRRAIKTLAMIIHALSTHVMSRDCKGVV